MGMAQKLTILVVIQITLIISSFFTLAYFESQTVLAGNAVNVAGKNRVLTNEVTLEILGVDSGGTASQGRVLAAIEDLEQNVHFLKNGGDLDGIEITPLAPRFEPEWEDVVEKLAAYKGVILSALSESTTMRPETVGEINRLGDDLVDTSDTLTTLLGHDTENISRNLILMQVSLGIVNVATHLFMIVLILNLFKKNTERQIKIEKMATIGEFAAVLAHDIRNPLGTIRNSVEILLRRKGLAESTVKDLSRIARATERISWQVDSTLGYLHAVPLVLEPNHVLHILRRSTGAVEIPSHITLEIPSAGSDLVVECDSDKIEIVFINLLMNAVQAIGSQTGRIGVKVQDDHNHVIIDFENSHADIPKENLPHIFDPLFTTKMEGTGLGLASCRNIVDLHNGTISAHISGGLVTFSIRLPKRQDDGS